MGRTVGKMIIYCAIMVYAISWAKLGSAQSGCVQSKLDLK